MKSVCAAAIFLSIASCISQGEEINRQLAPSSDGRLTTILNQLELVAEAGKDESGFSVRIFKVQDLGECGPKLSNCPSQTLYVAVSTRDVAAEQAVFVLPPAVGWRFVRWVSLPKDDFQGSVVVVELERTEIVGPGQVSKTKMELQFSPYGEMGILRITLRK